MTDWKENYRNRVDKITDGGKKNMTQIVIYLDDAENKIVNLYKVQNNFVSKQDAIRDIVRKQHITIDTAKGDNSVEKNPNKNSRTTA